MAVVQAIKGIPKTIIVEIALARSTGVIFLDFCLQSYSLVLIFAVSITCPIHCIIPNMSLATRHRYLILMGNVGLFKIAYFSLVIGDKI
jgi:hypothetical protein